MKDDNNIKLRQECLHVSRDTFDKIAGSGITTAVIIQRAEAFYQYVTTGEVAAQKFVANNGEGDGA